MTDPIEPLRIVLMISGLGINGVAVHCLLLIQYLLSRGHRVLLLHRPGAWIAERPGIEAAEKFATTFARTPGELIRVARRLNQFEPDVLHTHMSSAHTYGMLARIFSQRPVVATAHSSSMQLHWWFNNAVIATSPDAEAHHLKVNRVSPKAMRMIPSFIDTRAFPVISAQERSAARAALDLPQDAFVIGSVGDISPRKRQIDLVHALVDVAKAEPAARLLLVGDRFLAYTDELHRTAAELGVASRILTTGSRNDVPALLAAMDVFVQSSRKESSPLAVLEALSRGLPVIATDVGMLSDFISEDRTGHIVQVGDVDAIARRLTTLATDPGKRLAMGDAAQQAVRANYDMAVIAPRVERELYAAAKTRNRPLLGFVARSLGS